MQFTDPMEDNRNNALLSVLAKKVDAIRGRSPCPITEPPDGLLDRLKQLEKHRGTLDKTASRHLPAEDDAVSMPETAESELAKCEEEVYGDIIAADLRALQTEFKRAIARVKQMPTFLKLRNSSVRRGAPVFVTRTELPPAQGSVRAKCNSCQAEDRTVRSVRCLGVAFLSEECGDGTNGLRYNVVLADDMDPRQTNFVLAHEVAHVVLGHCDRRYPKERELPMLNPVSLDPPDDLPFPASPQGHGLYDMRDFSRCPACDAPNPLSRRRKTLIRHKALVESEAEATAFLVMASTAFTEAGNSSSLLDDAAKYIARHGGTGKLLLLQKQRILAAASRIAPLFRTL